MTERPKRPDSKQPAGKTSATRPPAAKTSGAKPPTAKTPAAKTPAAKTPLAKTPAGKTSLTKTPLTKTPLTKTSLTKTSQAKTSQAKTAGELADPVRPAPPRSIKIAMWLMYAGAALTGIGLILSVITILLGRAALKVSHPHATAAELQATLNFQIIVSVFSGLIEIVVWLLVARANRGGMKWARTVAGGLFAVSTWYLVTHLRGDSVANLVYTVLTWLVGLGAIIFLWRRESSAYFGWRVRSDG